MTREQMEERFRQEFLKNFGEGSMTGINGFSGLGAQIALQIHAEARREALEEALQLAKDNAWEWGAYDAIRKLIEESK